MKISDSKPMDIAKGLVLLYGGYTLIRNIAEMGGEAAVLRVLRAEKKVQEMEEAEKKKKAPVKKKTSTKKKK